MRSTRSFDRLAGAALALIAAATAAAYQPQTTPPPPPAAQPQPPRPAPPGADSADRFVAHPEHIVPGLVRQRGVGLRNPYEGSARAVAAGANLYVAYNCVDCHGAGGSGAMAPSLADRRWHFGGSPGELFESISQGRPEGMPAWGSLIAADQIWMLVSYLQSLQAGAKDVTTENFTGRTVERTGH